MNRLFYLLEVVGFLGLVTGNVSFAHAETQQIEQSRAGQTVEGVVDSATKDAPEITPAPPEKGQGNLHDMAQQLQSFPIGKERDYYRQTLERHDFNILSEYGDDQHWEFVVEKSKHNLRLVIEYDPLTGKSVHVTATGERVVE